MVLVWRGLHAIFTGPTNGLDAGVVGWHSSQSPSDEGDFR
jgi:hypothetical protein